MGWGCAALSLGAVVKGGFHVYAASLANNFAGFAFWLIVSRLAGPEIVGAASAVVGFAVLVGSVIELGVGVGVQRQVGACRVSGVSFEECASKYLWSCINVWLPLYIVVGCFTCIYGLFLGGFDGFGGGMAAWAGVLIALYSYNLLSSTLIALLRTELRLKFFMVGNVVRLVTGTVLVALGLGWEGAVAGFASMFLIVNFLTLLSIVRSLGYVPVIELRLLREVVAAGLSYWFPSVMVLAGQWVGVLAVYGSSSSVETGHYYVAITLAGAVAAVGTSISMVLIPVLSGMREGRASLVESSLRLALAVSSPAAAFIAAYPGFVLSILGESYVDAGNALSLVAVSIPAVVLHAIVSSLALSLGLNRLVAVMGLAQNLPRLALYVLLVSRYGSVGAAAAYAAGSAAGLAAAVAAAGRLGLRLAFQRLAAAAGLPFVLTAAARLAGLPAWLGFAVALASYAVYSRLSVIGRREVAEAVGAVLPRSLASRLYAALKPLIDALFPP